MKTFLGDEANREQARERAKRNKEFWCMVCGNKGLSYTELVHMEFYTYYEAVEAVRLYGSSWSKETGG